MTSPWATKKIDGQRSEDAGGKIDGRKISVEVIWAFLWITIEKVYFTACEVHLKYFLVSPDWLWFISMVNCELVILLKN